VLLLCADALFGSHAGQVTRAVLAEPNSRKPSEPTNMAETTGFTYAEMDETHTAALIEAEARCGGALMNVVAPLFTSTLSLHTLDTLLFESW
jgi:hypothetical protein